MSNLSESSVELEQLTDVGWEPRLSEAVPRFDRRSTMAAVRKYSVVSGARTTAVLLFQWLVLFGAIYTAVRMDVLWVDIIAMTVVGTRIQYLGILLHEATHYLLYRRRWLNDLVSDLFVAYPLGLSTPLYRYSHFRHHWNTNTARDPDFVFQRADRDQHFPKSPAKMGMLMIKSAFGVNLPRMLGFTRAWMPAPNIFTPLSRVFPLHSRLTFVIWSITVWGGLWITDSLAVFAQFYLLPALFWSNVINRIRSMAEHGGTENTHELNSTRTVIPTIIDRIVIAPLGVSYHIEHHLFPSIPGRFLEAMHKDLTKEKAFLASAHITYGYWSVIRELMGKKWAPAN